VARGARPNPEPAVVAARRQMAVGAAGRHRVPAPGAVAVQGAMAVQGAAVPGVVVARVAAPVEAAEGPLATEAGMSAEMTIVVHLAAGR